MANEAARLAEALRAGKKQRGLSGAQIAEQIERLTGSRPGLMWVSRRLHGQAPIMTDGSCRTCGRGGGELRYESPASAAMAVVLGVDPDEVLAGSDGAEVSP